MIPCLVIKFATIFNSFSQQGVDSATLLYLSWFCDIFWSLDCTSSANCISFELGPQEYLQFLLLLILEFSNHQTNWISITCWRLTDYTKKDPAIQAAVVKFIINQPYYNRCTNKPNQDEPDQARPKEIPNSTQFELLTIKSCAT